jgi:peptide/nickel transport system ATP-binding protein
VVFRYRKFCCNTQACQATKTETLSLFDKVKLPNPEILFDKYPRFQEGKKQRVMIAMAIACKPQLLIADEPTTIDVTVQKKLSSC